MNQLEHLRHPGRHLARLIGLMPILLLAAFSVGWVQDLQRESGTVSGEVVNGTPGGSVPDDLTVTLHTFSDMTETNTYTTTLTGEGSYLFEDVTLEEEHTVVARVIYEGVTYVSELATVEADQQGLFLPVTIFETTQDAANIEISQLHLFVNQMGEQVQVGAYAVVGNAGSRTYVGSSDEDIRTTWSVRLPEGAQNLQFDTADLGGRFIPLADGFADTRPIPPGAASAETSFTYELAFREGVEIEQSFEVPVRAVVLVLPEGDWGLRGAGISSQGTLDTQMGPALSYTAGPLQAGEPLAFAIVPRASAPEAMPDARSPSGLPLGIAALVAAGAAVVLMWRSSSPGPVPASVRDQVEAIAALDRDFEDGKLSEKAYLERRRSLKHRLRQTLSEQRPSHG